MTFHSAAEKRAYVQDMFDRLSARYERVNQIMSLGRVAAWRRRAALKARPSPGGRVLDVAAGHGGLSLALARQWPQAHIASLDFSSEMIQVGRRWTRGQPVHWTEGDALKLPFPDNCFDAVVNGFMLRNVTDVPGTLAEQTRVVRPGGTVACLEMTWPRGPFRHFFRLYFYGLVPLLGWLLTGQREAYRYLPRSVEAFLSPDELVAVMEQAGLQQVQYRTMMMGTVALHVGKRGDEG